MLQLLQSVGLPMKHQKVSFNNSMETMMTEEFEPLSNLQTRHPVSSGRFTMLTLRDIAREQHFLEPELYSL